MFQIILKKIKLITCYLSALIYNYPINIKQLGITTVSLDKLGEVIYPDLKEF